jgi:hypothetical protein
MAHLLCWDVGRYQMQMPGFRMPGPAGGSGAKVSMEAWEDACGDVVSGMIHPVRNSGEHY